MRRVLSVMSMQGLPSAWRRLALGLLASCVLNSASWAQGVQAEPDSMWPDAPASDMALVRWLSSQPDFRLGVERDYGPFVFADEHGEPQGLSVDALALVSRHVGLRYITALQAPLGTLLQAARRGELDVLTSLRENAERSEFLLFTAPYASVPAVVVTREGARADDLGRLQGQSVGVGQGYAVEAHVRARFPLVHWVPEPDDVAALKAVAAGRLAAAVVDQASFAFVQQRHGLAHLHMGEPVGFDYALSFAVRKDLPQLRDALDLGVRALSMDDRRQLRERWLVPASGPARWPRWAPWAAALVVVSAGVLAWRVIATRQLPRLDHSAPLQSG